MLENKPKLHFIHYLDYKNIGDWLASPINYFPDYFMERYNVEYHCLEFIKWNEIAPCDAIILGGGGLLENEAPIQEWINRMLDMCNCVIAWGVGFHKRSGLSAALPEIDYSRFALLTVRDYGHPTGLEYLPCVTCLLPQLRKKRKIKREIGVINHVVYAITGSGFEAIDNSAGIEEMTDFIAESGVILTTSYHAAYWSLLMGKKTIVARVWANKFEYFERKPVLLSELTVENVNAALAAGGAISHDGWLDECIDLNLAFFERVKTILEKSIPPAGKSLTSVNLLKQQVWNSMSLHLRMNDIVTQVNSLVGQIEQRFEQLEEKIDASNRSKR